MDIQMALRELGIYEIAADIAKFATSESVNQKVGAYMPLPSDDIEERAAFIAKSLLASGKTKFLFFHPEIAIIDEHSKNTKSHIEVYIPVPYELDNDSIERLSNNFPRNLDVRVIEERSIARYIHPGDGIMVTTGYIANGRLMVLPDTYIMFENSRKIKCRKVFASYVELNTALRYEGWVEMKSESITEIRRCHDD